MHGQQAGRPLAAGKRLRASTSQIPCSLLQHSYPWRPHHHQPDQPAPAKSLDHAHSMRIACNRQGRVHPPSPSHTGTGLEAHITPVALQQPHPQPSRRQQAGHDNQTGGKASRRMVLHGLSWPAASALLPGGFGALLEEVAPQTGSCPTCIGAVDGTLGSCSGVSNCMSSYDDRPGHFIAPWAHEERGSERALNKIQRAVEQEGGSIQLRQRGYLYAVFEDGYATDDVEFLLPDEDTTVELRAASRSALPDFGRLKNRFEDLRNSCGFEVVPILRNRQQLLGVVESPWDTFGPTPPTDMDFGDLEGVGGGP